MDDDENVIVIEAGHGETVTYDFGNDKEFIDICTRYRELSEVMQVANVAKAERDKLKKEIVEILGDVDVGLVGAFKIKKTYVNRKEFVVQEKVQTRIVIRER